MVPSSVAAHEGASEGFAGMGVEREDKDRVVIGRPPRMRRAVVLPEFADGAGLPATAWFGAAFGREDLLGKMLADVGGDGGAGAMEVVAAGHLGGPHQKDQRPGVGGKLGPEAVGRVGPGVFHVANGGR